MMLCFPELSAWTAKTFFPGHRYVSNGQRIMGKMGELQAGT